jgi:hypothetical protein
MSDTVILIGILFAAALLLLLNWPQKNKTESFVNMEGKLDSGVLAAATTQAIDAAPSASEVKLHYKNLLIYADADIKQQGVRGLRLLADMRDRLFSEDLQLADGTYPDRNFRDDLTVTDYLGNWPTWLPPMDPTMKEPIPSSSDAVLAEQRILAYIQRYYAAAPTSPTDSNYILAQQIWQDFGRRFVFKSTETPKLRPDFMQKPLLRGWTNPIAKI